MQILQKRLTERLSFSWKTRLLVIVYLVPVAVIKILSSTWSSSVDLPVVEIVENQLVIIAGAEGSQDPYWYRPDKEKDLEMIQRENLKTILFWNGLFYYPDYAFGRGRKPFLEANCPVNTCMTTDDPYLFPSSEKFDAIMFHWPSLCDIPHIEKRNQDQLFIMVSDESPQWKFSGYKLNHYQDFFNLSMTYRRDSDIYWPYGQIETLPEAPKTPEDISNLREKSRKNSTINYASGKSKLAVWFVSHCKTDSRREFYVHVLQEYVHVDVFGKCGKSFCSFDQLTECYARIEIDYKFYLSFENSLCRDYTTEKFFNLLDHNIVPVVYGAGDYERFAPPHSYIDALKYTPRQLAEYLKLLDENDDLYNEYFWWKPYYKSHYDYRQMANLAFCKLCEILHQPRQYRQWYRDIDAWYDGGHHCHMPNRFRVPIKKFDFENYTVPQDAIVKIPI